MIPPFPYPTSINPPFPVPILVKERLQHLRSTGGPTVTFNDVDVVFEGVSLVTTKKTHELSNSGLSSIFMDHTEMYGHAHSTFMDLFGIDANVNLISYLSPDKAYSCFLITHNDFIVNSSGGKSLKLLLHLRSNLLNSTTNTLDRIEKENEIRKHFPNCSIIRDNEDDVDPFRLEIKLPPGVYPVIASQNPRGHDETPKFCLLLASHYDDKFSLMRQYDNAYTKDKNKNNSFLTKDHNTIHVDDNIRQGHGQFPIYGFTSLNVKQSFIKTHIPSTTNFNININKELYNKFFDAILELLILNNMAEIIPLTKIDFRAILADFYHKRNLVTSVKTDKNLETNLMNLYATAKNYINPLANPKMSSYIDFFIKSNLIEINRLYSNNPENIFNNSILKDKDSYSRFKSEDKIPNFINGTALTPLYHSYKKEQTESLEKLILAGYPF